MDKFERYAIIVMIGIVTAMAIGAYLGVFIVGGEMETRYIVIIEEQAEQLHLNPTHLVELGETGEYIAFSVAGAIAGLVIGYLIPQIFEEEQKIRRGR